MQSPILNIRKIHNSSGEYHTYHVDLRHINHIVEDCRATPENGQVHVLNLYLDTGNILTITLDTDEAYGLINNWMNCKSKKEEV